MPTPIIPSYYSAVTKLVNYIQTSVTTHQQFRYANIHGGSFALGELTDKAITGSDLYPYAFLEFPLKFIYGLNTIEWDLVLEILDLELVERANELDRVNYCVDIMNDILEKFKKDDIYTLKDDANIMSLTQKRDDFAAGVRAEFRLIQPINMNKCSIYDRFSCIFNYDLGNPWVSNDGPFYNDNFSKNLHLQASGGSQYSWTGPNNFTSNLKNPVINGSASGMTGDYRVVIADSSGCTTAITTTVGLVPTLTLAISAQTSDSGSCDGTVSIIASGGYPLYLYDFDNGNITLDGYYENICAGVHTASVIDQLGYTAGPLPIIIT